MLTAFVQFQKSPLAVAGGQNCVKLTITCRDSVADGEGEGEAWRWRWSISSSGLELVDSCIGRWYMETLNMYCTSQPISPA